MVTYQDEYYLIINETITKRHNKYKALMRHCNFTLEIENVIDREIIDYDRYGRPIYEYIYGDPFIIPLIISEKTFSIDDRYSLRVASNNIIITVQDNKQTQEHFAINEI